VVIEAPIATVDGAQNKPTYVDTSDSGSTAPILPPWRVSKPSVPAGPTSGRHGPPLTTAKRARVLLLQEPCIDVAQSRGPVPVKWLQRMSCHDRRGTGSHTRDAEGDFYTGKNLPSAVFGCRRAAERITVSLGCRHLSASMRKQWRAGRERVRGRRAVGPGYCAPS